jgi:hypothetical protein
LIKNWKVKITTQNKRLPEYDSNLFFLSDATKISWKTIGFSHCHLSILGETSSTSIFDGKDQTN